MTNKKILHLEQYGPDENPIQFFYTNDYKQCVINNRLQKKKNKLPFTEYEQEIHKRERLATSYLQKAHQFIEDYDEYLNHCVNDDTISINDYKSFRVWLSLVIDEYLNRKKEIR